MIDLNMFNIGNVAAAATGPPTAEGTVSTVGESEFGKLLEQVTTNEQLLPGAIIDPQALLQTSAVSGETATSPEAENLLTVLREANSGSAVESQTNPLKETFSTDLLLNLETETKTPVLAPELSLPRQGRPVASRLTVLNGKSELPTQKVQSEALQSMAADSGVNSQQQPVAASSTPIDLVVVADNPELVQRQMTQSALSSEQQNTPTLDQRFAGLIPLRKSSTNHQSRSIQLNPSEAGQQRQEQTVIPDLPDGAKAFTVDQSQAPGKLKIAEMSLQEQQVSTEVKETAQNILLRPHQQPVETLIIKQPEPGKLELPSGRLVHDQQILDQVVVKLSGNIKGDIGKATMRLYPAELGEIRLELSFEQDRLKAQLHAQTTQVQEVLERNMPKLKTALEQQGLKIDTLQVNVDSRGAEQQMFHQHSFGQQRQMPTFTGNKGQGLAANNTPEPPRPKVHAATAGRGLSLRI